MYREKGGMVIGNRRHFGWNGRERDECLRGWFAVKVGIGEDRDGGRVTWKAEQCNSGSRTWYAISRGMWYNKSRLLRIADSERNTFAWNVK